MHRLLSSLRFTYNNTHSSNTISSSRHDHSNQNNRRNSQMFQFNWNRNSNVPRGSHLNSATNQAQLNHNITNNYRQNRQERQHTQTSTRSILFQSDIDYDDISIDHEIDSNDTIDDFITDEEFLETIIRDDTNDSIMYVNYLQNNEYNFMDLNTVRNMNATDSTYYSILMYHGERIQFNHNDILTPADTQDIMENFMIRINEDVFDHVMNETLQQTSQHEKTAEDIQCGYVWINAAGRYAGAPYGGWKLSGLGVEECFDELKSYTKTKNINLKWV